MFNKFNKLNSTAQKMGFPLGVSSVNVTKSAVSCDLVTFTAEIFNGKLHFFVQCTLNKCKPYFNKVHTHLGNCY